MVEISEEIAIEENAETRQISNLRSQDVPKEILSDLFRKNSADFRDQFFHFQYVAPGNV